MDRGKTRSADSSVPDYVISMELYVVSSAERNQRAGTGASS
jgi:hypothetical protein